jgi:acetolactate synthase-1/2/3 large subunit
MNNRVTGCFTLHAHLREFFMAANESASKQEFAERTEWLRQIDELRRMWPDTSEIKDVPGINPNVFMHQLSKVSQSATAYIVDVGQHQMWAAQSLELNADQRFLTSGGMGSMGFALPAAVGAAVVSENRPVVVVAGDGGFQSNIQELQTVARNQLPIKIVVINNNCHGMVRQFQESYFDSRYQSTLWGYSAPDFGQVAKAYGIDGHTVEETQDVDAALQWLWREPQSPSLLQVMVNTYANAYPKIAFGHPMTEMEPFATPIEMEGT